MTVVDVVPVAVGLTVMASLVAALPHTYLPVTPATPVTVVVAPLQREVLAKVAVMLGKPLTVTGIVPEAVQRC